MISENNENANCKMPFSLAYLDWCKERGVKNIQDTENIDLIKQFYSEAWYPKEVNGIEYGIARGIV